MQALQVFRFKGADVRTVMVDGSPWWVAADVCGILGIANHRDALSRLDDDEKGVASTDTLGGIQDVATVNESGLYSLVLSSRKKQAKDFKKWVTAEVLPSIRKTGSYSVAPADLATQVALGMVQIQQAFPQLAASVSAVEAKTVEAMNRLAAVEERQQITDPREIESRMFQLRQVAKAIVEGSKGRTKPVTFGAFWPAVGAHVRVSSFQNRAALTVPQMDEAIRFARQWAFEVGIEPPSLFDSQAVG